MAVGDFPNATVRAWILFLMSVALPERPWIPTKRLVGLMEDIGYEVGATRVALSRLCADSRLERRRSGRETSYRLERREADTMAYVRERVNSFGEEGADWDGSWTIVLASLPDELRTTRYQLKSRLAFLGFGRLRETVWCAARDCEDELKGVLEGLGLEDTVHVFIGKPSFLMDIDALMHQCWDIDSLTSGYGDFVSKFSPLRTAAARRALSDDDTLLWWLKVTHDYRSLVLRDPGLPSDLLPPSPRKLRAKAVETFSAVDAGLRDRATDHILHTFGL